MAKKFTAAKAIINYQGKILIIKESPEYNEGTMGDKYVVPGGRLKNNENLEEALLREVNEETSLRIKVGKSFFSQEGSNNINGEDSTIKRIFFKCFSNTCDVKLNREHRDFKWINPEDYNDYNLAFNLKEVFQAYLSQKR